MKSNWKSNGNERGYSPLTWWRLSLPYHNCLAGAQEPALPLMLLKLLLLLPFVTNAVVSFITSVSLLSFFYAWSLCLRRMFKISLYFCQFFIKRQYLYFEIVLFGPYMLLIVILLNFPFYQCIISLFLIMFWLDLYLSSIKISILALFWFILG